MPQSFILVCFKMALGPTRGSIWKLIKFAHTWEMLSWRSSGSCCKWCVCTHTFAHAHRCEVPFPSTTVLHRVSKWPNFIAGLTGSAGAGGFLHNCSLPSYSGERVKIFSLWPPPSLPHAIPFPPKKHFLWVIVNVKDQELIPGWHFD